MEMSPLHKKRMATPLIVPSCLKNIEHTRLVPAGSCSLAPEILLLFPKQAPLPLLQAKPAPPLITPLKKIGVVFSGGPASGGHNVIAGLLDALKESNPRHVLLGFLGGPSGLLEEKHILLTPKILAPYRNIGGFDLLGTGRTKIETPEQMAKALATCSCLDLDALIIIGGDDSQTNTALLSHFFLEKQAKTIVIGIPKTIDGDLRAPGLPISFGFDTACKTYAETIGNIGKDALSSCKYTHFIRLMGRSASHIALECALLTQPNYTLIGEEIAIQQKTLQAIVQDLTDLVIARQKKQKPYGLILLPEGLLYYIKEIAILMEELTAFLANQDLTSPAAAIAALSPSSKRCFDQFPEKMQEQLLLHRDPHGNIQVSWIETEHLLAELVDKELQKRGCASCFTPICHFLGYEGRCAFPSSFDAHYSYALGKAAFLLVQSAMSGYMVAIQNVEKPVDKWQVQAIPLVSLLHKELRKGESKPVIRKDLVDLHKPAFRYFSSHRESWMLEDHYRYPGPMQFEEDIPLSLRLDLEAKDR